MKSLMKTLRAAGKKPRIHETGDGTRLLVLPYGARVLGLYAKDNDLNFYWVNPELRNHESAKALFAGEGWHNTGGDRTWLAPELDIFFPDYPDVRRHWEPPQLDASEYVTKAGRGVLSLRRKMALHLARPNRAAELELTKTLGPAPNPVRYERRLAQHLETVEYAGYTLRTQVRLLGETAEKPVPLGIWNLVQLPWGGEMLAPTYSKTRPRILFGEIPSENLVCTDRLVRFRVALKGEQKLALRAVATTGRTGYAYEMGSQRALVIRNFMVNPSGAYVDVPKDEPEDFGYSVNAVNVKSGLGDFCEMEYHAPALGHDMESALATDISQIWAFRGRPDDIDVVARELLGSGLFE